MKVLARLFLSLAIVGFAATAYHAGAAATAAAGCIQIGAIQFDSPGADNGSNASLNGEWITVKSTCATAKSLNNWKIKDKANHVYKFTNYSLGAGKTVKIHTGKGTNSTTDRYWRQDGYVWNNTGDKATLKNSGGTVVDTCTYGSSGSKVNC